MKKHLLGFSILVYLLYSVNAPLLAQSVCVVSLSDAQDNFESGHLYGIPPILKPCLDNGFSKSEKIQAYWLLTRTYLIIDDPISAEDSYLKLLKLDPEYNIDDENDPIEVVYLSRKFKTTPIFTWTYGKGGLNTTSTSIINRYTTGNNNTTSISYSGEIGFQLGSSIEFNISDQWSLNAEVMLAKRSFSLSNTLFTEDKQFVREDQFWAEFPLYLKYSRSFDRFHPYVFGGYALQYLLRADVKPEFINVEETAELKITGVNVALTDARTRFTRSAILGAGVRYRVGYHYLMFEVRYTIGLKNLLNKQNQYNKELPFRYGYVDSDFKINSLSVIFGFVKPLYKPRKIDAGPHFTERLFNKKRDRNK